MKAQFPELTQDLVTTRRAIFGGVTILILAVALGILIEVCKSGGFTGLGLAIVILFVPLFAQIAAGVTLAVVGFVQRVRGGDPVRIGRLADMAPGESLPATALVMPVFNEQPDRVFNGTESMWLSLAATGKDGNFDFFVLSDSDRLESWLAEECRWFELCRNHGTSSLERRRFGASKSRGLDPSRCRWLAFYRRTRT